MAFHSPGFSNAHLQRFCFLPRSIPTLSSKNQLRNFIPHHLPDVKQTMPTEGGFFHSYPNTSGEDIILTAVPHPFRTNSDQNDIRKAVEWCAQDAFTMEGCNGADDLESPGFYGRSSVQLPYPQHMDGLSSTTTYGNGYNPHTPASQARNRFSLPQQAPYAVNSAWGPPNTWAVPPSSTPDSFNDTAFQKDDWAALCASGMALNHSGSAGQEAPLKFEQPLPDEVSAYREKGVFVTPNQAGQVAAMTTYTDWSDLNGLPMYNCTDEEAGELPSLIDFSTSPEEMDIYSPEFGSDPSSFSSHRSPHRISETQSGSWTTAEEPCSTEQVADFSTPKTITIRATGIGQRRQKARLRPDTNHRRTSKDEYLLNAKQSGMTYREIRIKGGFIEAESTLRGRYRALTKGKEQRVRKPVWTVKDTHLLRKAVREQCDTDKASSLADRHVDVSNVSWKTVADYIASHGGSYQFGNATCKKKWLALCGSGH